MKQRRLKQNGFSLTEVMIATGVLAMGMVLVAMVFPVGVKLASVSTERVISTAAADEAFVKMQIYGNLDPSTISSASLVTNSFVVFEPPLLTIPGMNSAVAGLTWQSETFYPSDPTIPQMEIRYYWTALARRTAANSKELQMTVFVSRILGTGASYWTWTTTPPSLKTGLRPVPVKVNVQVKTYKSSRDSLLILPSAAQYPPLGSEYTFFSDGVTLLQDDNGDLYQVMEIKDTDSNGTNETLVLDRAFNGALNSSRHVWVVPPAAGNTRNPCIGVYQRTVTFK